MPQKTIDSPQGPLRVTERDGVITRLTWGAGGKDTTPLLEQAARQLAEYFEGRRQNFDLPLAPEGTPFQKRVWQEMQRIPFGETMSYGEMAQKVGSVARAVGGACGANPIPIIIPCHRVVGAGRELGGFSGGSGRESKRALLDHEGASPPQLSFF